MKPQTLSPEARSIARDVFDGVLDQLEYSSVYENDEAEDLTEEEQHQIYWYVTAMLMAVDTRALDAQIAAECAERDREVQHDH